MEIGESTLILLFVSKKRTRVEKTEAPVWGIVYFITEKWNIMQNIRGLETNISFNSMHEVPNKGNGYAKCSEKGHLAYFWLHTLPGKTEIRIMPPLAAQFPLQF